MLSCDPSSLTRLDFSQPSLVLRGVYRVTKCVLCTTLKMCGLPDDMLYPASWGEIQNALARGQEVMVVGSGAGVKALGEYLGLVLVGGGCQDISYGGVPIYTCPPGGARIPRAYIVTDGATARYLKEKLKKALDEGTLTVVAVGGERDAPELSGVILGLPILWAGGKGYLFAPGYSTPDRWLWLTPDGPVSSKVALVMRLATSHVVSASRRQEEVK
ncbi:hypothetical protein TthHB5018_c25860 (plasmid) [Thermus thermophilus]|uniref:Uncharacterized protein n=1 Tax=Thermus thermophilus TaxID=274 RepID=A0A7R7TGE0_THETH|nr:hypothetical protein TthHB5018_c25860 [Thermus thermophilus]